jgi:hypothetical protein
MIHLALTLMLLSAPPAHADWCSGILTSNGVCIGSSGNTAPPVIYCAPDSSDPRCWRQERR